MSNRFLELKDGIIVEVARPREAREEMSTSELEQVETRMRTVGKMLEKITVPLAESLRDLKAVANTPIIVSEAEVEFGLSFSAEGTIFISKSTVEASLSIRVKFVAVSAKIEGSS